MRLAGRIKTPENVQIANRSKSVIHTARTPQIIRPGAKLAENLRLARHTGATQLLERMERFPRCPCDTGEGCQVHQSAAKRRGTQGLHLPQESCRANHSKIERNQAVVPTHP